MRTEEEIIQSIKNEIPYVDIKEYSHNIISLELRMYSEIKGDEETYKLIKELGLDKLGW